MRKGIMDFVLSQMIFRPKQKENVRASLNREEISKCGKGKFIPGINELRITP
jgi:hypothetical protein